MRPLFLSLGGILAVSVAAAQNAGDSSSNVPQLPVGQVSKQFTYPFYENGMLKYTLSTAEAKGITLNRAETIDLKIEVYDNGKRSTLITSPKADLYVAEQKMRTKNTVLIDRDDMQATSQNCDFDVKSKKYVLRNNVKVVLKHFDLTTGPDGKKATSTTPAPTPAPASSSTPAPVTEPAAPTSTPAPVAEPAPTPAAPRTDSLPTSPSAYLDTNSAPISPALPNAK